MATIRNGMDSMASVIRMMSPSTHPLENPESSPSEC